jgi:predicted deacylase
MAAFRVLPSEPGQGTISLAAEIDFDRNGKQHGFIRLPYWVHRSAYGWIPIPVASIKNARARESC